ncbi:EAL domain-containing protein [Microbacterium sp. HJ5]
MTSTDTLVRDLQQAIADRTLTIAYQPQFELDGAAIEPRPVAVEALCRWSRDDGDVPPSTFIPLAEEANLVEDIDIQMLERGATQLVEWQRSGRTVGLAANASPTHITLSYADAVVTRLDRFGVDPAAVTIEITETPWPQLQPQMVEALHRLRSFGVAISIDDFGAGETTLAMIESLPIDEVKIDRSLIQRADAEADAAVAEVVSRADAQGWRIVAEGIETTDDLERSIDRGCHRGQGYLLAAPMDVEEFERLLGDPAR